ncbi:hypothetical protein Tco_1569234 [Tanacetum coccineum]
MAKPILSKAREQNLAEPRDECNEEFEFKIGKEEGLLNDEVSNDEEWDEHEYENPPNDSFPKPYLNINNEKDKNHHNENNGDADKSSGKDLSGAP